MDCILQCASECETVSPTPAKARTSADQVLRRSWRFAGDPVMIVMWSAYLVNAVYGYLMWLYKCGRSVPFKRLLEIAAKN